MAGGMLLTAPPALAASGSPYEALRVGRAGTQVEIKGAYRAMAKRLELSAGLLSTPGCRPTSGNGTTASSTTWALSVLRTAGVPEVRALGNLPDAAPMLRGM